MVELYKGDLFSNPEPQQSQTNIGYIAADGSWFIPSIVEGQKVELDYYIGRRCITCSLPFEAAVYSQDNSMLILLCKRPTGELEPRQILCDCIVPKLGVYTS